MLKYLKIFLLNQIKQYDENFTYILEFLEFVTTKDSTNIIKNILQIALKFKKTFKLFTQKDRLDIFLRQLLMDDKMGLFGTTLEQITYKQLQQYYKNNAYILLKDYRQQVITLLKSFNNHIFNCLPYIEKDTQIQKISYFTDKITEYKKQQKQKQQQDSIQSDSLSQLSQLQSSYSSQFRESTIKQTIQQVEQQDIKLLLSDILKDKQEQNSASESISLKQSLRSSQLIDQNIMQDNNQLYFHQQTQQNFQSILYYKIQYLDDYLTQQHIKRQIKVHNICDNIINTSMIQEQSISLSIPIDKYLYIFEGQYFLQNMTKNISYEELIQVLDETQYNKNDSSKCAICKQPLTTHKNITLPNQILTSESYLKFHVCDKCYQFYNRLYQVPCILTSLCPHIITYEQDFQKMIYLSRKIILWQKINNITIKNINQEDNEVIINENCKLTLQWQTKHLITTEDAIFVKSQITGNYVLINSPYISFNDILNCKQLYEQLQQFCQQIIKKLYTPQQQSQQQILNLQNQPSCICGKQLQILEDQTYVCFKCGAIQHQSCKFQNHKNKCYVCKQLKQ